MTLPAPSSLPPNPQFARDGWTDLTGTWEFAFDDADRGLAEGWADGRSLPQTITVPFPPESQASGIGDTGFHPVVWYARALDVGPAEPGERVLVHFGAVDYACRVYCDGQPVTEHVGGMTPFTADVTDALSDGDDHRLVVRVFDDPHSLDQPRGKQTWHAEPEGIYYDRTTGIWQPVWLERVPAQHLTALHWDTDLDRGVITATYTLARTPEPGTTVRVGLSHDGEALGGATGEVAERTGRISVPLESLRGWAARPLLWSANRPILLDAAVGVITADGDADEVRSYLGVRSVGVRDGMLCVNGAPVYLRFALEQGFWPQSHLTPPDEAAIKREVELVRDLGFNGIRIHQKVEDPRFLYWCDRLGVYVWGEMANAIRFTEASQRALLHEWPSVIARDRSHPSILAWVPINESWGVQGLATDQAKQDFATTLYHLTRSLDPSRPAMSNEGWEHTVSDIHGVHDYTPYGDSIRDRYNTDALEDTLTGAGPGRHKILLRPRPTPAPPVMITEFGGLSYAPKSGEAWFGYSTATSPEDYLARFADLVGAIVEQPGLAGFCYTQLTDTQQESNGLLTADRAPKLPIDKINAVLTAAAAAIPAESVDAYRRAATRNKR